MQQSHVWIAAVAINRSQVPRRKRQAYGSHCAPSWTELIRGVARIFQRGVGGGGWVTVCQSEGTHQIVTSFSPPVVGCLLEKSSQKGVGVTGTPAPPLATPLLVVIFDEYNYNVSLQVHPIGIWHWVKTWLIQYKRMCMCFVDLAHLTRPEINSFTIAVKSYAVSTLHSVNFLLIYSSVRLHYWIWSTRLFFYFCQPVLKISSWKCSASTQQLFETP